MRIKKILKARRPITVEAIKARRADLVAKAERQTKRAGRNPKIQNHTKESRETKEFLYWCSCIDNLRYQKRKQRLEFAEIAFRSNCEAIQGLTKAFSKCADALDEFNNRTFITNKTL